eukprot:Awhi_evm1s13049
MSKFGLKNVIFQSRKYENEISFLTNFRGEEIILANSQNLLVENDDIGNYKRVMQKILEFVKRADVERFGVMHKSVLFHNNFLKNYAKGMRDT